MSHHDKENLPASMSLVLMRILQSSMNPFLQKVHSNKYPLHHFSPAILHAAQHLRPQTTLEKGKVANLNISLRITTLRCILRLYESLYIISVLIDYDFPFASSTSSAHLFLSALCLNEFYDYLAMLFTLNTGTTILIPTILIYPLHIA
jgi:hypothetical protein